jgi:hypothetical protein
MAPSVGFTLAARDCAQHKRALPLYGHERESPRAIEAGKTWATLRLASLVVQFSAGFRTLVIGSPV